MGHASKKKQALAAQKRARPELIVLMEEALSFLRSSSSAFDRLGYLFLEGQAGDRGLASDHRDAHVVAGYQNTGLLQPPRRPDGRFDVDRLGGLLNAPVLAGGVGKDTRPVYHLAISAAKTDRLLSDREWADIAQEYLHLIGLAPRGDDQAVRWVAVRHVDDHIHVVATLVRQDGRRVFPRQDFLRSREASRAVEDRYGLTTTAPVGGTSTPETTRAEWRKHHQDSARRQAQGRPAPAGPDRQVLRARVQDVACAARSWEEFTERLGGDGVLVRPRSAPSTRVRSPATPSRCERSAATSTMAGSWSGSAAASCLRTSPCPDCASAGSRTTTAATAPTSTRPDVPPQPQPSGCIAAGCPA